MHPGVHGCTVAFMTAVSLGKLEQTGNRTYRISFLKDPCMELSGFFRSINGYKQDE